MGRRSYRSLCYAEDKKEKVDVLFFSSYKKSKCIMGSDSEGKFKRELKTFMLPLLVCIGWVGRYFRRFNLHMKIGTNKRGMENHLSDSFVTIQSSAFSYDSHAF